jgi:segregation and condensation protein B
MTIENGSTLPRMEILVESLLFVADLPVTVKHLAEAIECETNEVERALESLSKELEERGVRVQRNKGQVQLVTAPESTSFIERFLGLSQSGKLSPAALEALSIIAYKQPITRPDIEAIRGVGSDGVLRTLMAKGLIEEVGRLETVGHPVLYGTTFDFLQYFGLSSLEELPPLARDEEAPVADEQPDETVAPA